MWVNMARLKHSSLVLFLAALRAFPTRLSFLRVIPVLYPFLATARARRILTALVAVALATAGFTRYAFLFAGEAMACAASPNSKHHHMYLYQNVIHII